MKKELECECDFCAYPKTMKDVDISCPHCGDQDPPYYMVKDEVWYKAKVLHRKCVCISCLETGLGRKLTIEDFTNAPINRMIFIGYSLKSKGAAKKAKENAGS